MWMTYIPGMAAITQEKSLDLYILHVANIYTHYHAPNPCSKDKFPHYGSEQEQVSEF